MKKIQSLGTTLALCGFLVLTVATQTSKDFEIAKNLEIFASVYKEINSGYVDDIDPSKFMRTGIDAMLNSLDPFTNFISEAEIEGYRYQITGRYGGIGATIRDMGDYCAVSEPYEDAPVIKAGLQSGDLILEVDGKSAKGKTTDEVGEVLKGSPGTAVTLKIRRPVENNKEFEVKINRGEISVPNVPYYAMADEHTAYVVLSTFTEKAGQNVQEALEKLKKEHDVKNIILDLRNNGGGLLTEAINVSNVFIAKGEDIVSTKGRLKENDRNYKTLNQPFSTDMPLVVLINKSSASASEIVSGSVQDLDRGVLIGAKSYGKGLVQNTKDVGYNSKVKLTTSKYYIPSGRCIQAVKYDKGEPVEIADSLKTAFKTRNARTVFDGGGVMPDVKIDVLAQTPILAMLRRKHHIFNYSAEYKAKHPTIAPATEFNLTDADFADFLKYLEGKDTEYETESETALKKLEDKAKEEKYYEAIKTEIEAMRQRMLNDKKNDLNKHKQEILTLLEKEIASRYYYEKGRLQVGLTNDPEIQEALALFKDPARYNTLLNRK